MIMTMVTLITANITPTIIPILELLEDEVAKVEPGMSVVVESVTCKLVVVIMVVATVALSTLESNVVKVHSGNK